MDRIMTVAQKFLTGIIAIGMATTLILPGRQTANVIDAVRKLLTGSLATAMTGDIK